MFEVIRASKEEVEISNRVTALQLLYRIAHFGKEFKEHIWISEGISNVVGILESNRENKEIAEKCHILLLELGYGCPSAHISMLDGIINLMHSTSAKVIIIACHVSEHRDGALD